MKGPWMSRTSMLDGIPVVPGGLPALGHGVRLLRDPLPFLASLPELGAMCRIRVGSQSVVVVSDPALTWLILADDRTFDKGGPFYDRSREIAGDGLGTCPHSRHRRQRRLCQPAFRSQRMHGYTEIMTSAIAETVRTWDEGRIIDLGSEMSVMTFGVATETMFSTAVPESVRRRVAADLGEIAGGLFRRTMMPPAVSRLPTPDNRRYAAITRRVRDLAGSVIADRRADGADGGDLLSSLLSARDLDGSGAVTAFTDEELIDQVFTFFLAGAETSAGCITWALHLLDRNPDVLRRVHDEVDAVLGGRAAAPGDLPALPLLGRVVTETLRLYPPVWLVTRLVTEDTRLEGILLPAGTMVAVSPYLLHRRAGLYDNAADFVPDRWVDVAPNRMPYLPFGAGARSCIGQQFGLTEVVLALATITAHWCLSSSTGRPVPMALTQLPTPKGVRMRLTQRQVVRSAD